MCTDRLYLRLWMLVSALASLNPMQASLNNRMFMEISWSGKQQRLKEWWVHAPASPDSIGRLTAAMPLTVQPSSRVWLIAHQLCMIVVMCWCMAASPFYVRWVEPTLLMAMLWSQC